MLPVPPVPPPPARSRGSSFWELRELLGCGSGLETPKRGRAEPYTLHPTSPAQSPLYPPQFEGSSPVCGAPPKRPSAACGHPKAPKEGFFPPVTPRCPNPKPTALPGRLTAPGCRHQAAAVRNIGVYWWHQVTACAQTPSVCLFKLFFFSFFFPGQHRAPLGHGCRRDGAELLDAPGRDGHHRHSCTGTTAASIGSNQAQNAPSFTSEVGQGL